MSWSKFLKWQRFARFSNNVKFPKKYGILFVTLKPIQCIHLVNNSERNISEIVVKIKKLFITWQDRNRFWIFVCYKKGEINLWKKYEVFHLKNVYQPRLNLVVMSRIMSHNYWIGVRDTVCQKYLQKLDKWIYHAQIKMIFNTVKIASQQCRGKLSNKKYRVFHLKNSSSSRPAYKTLNIVENISKISNFSDWKRFSYRDISKNYE